MKSLDEISFVVIYTVMMKKSNMKLENLEHDFLNLYFLF